GFGLRLGLRLGFSLDLRRFIPGILLGFCLRRLGRRLHGLEDGGLDRVLWFGRGLWLLARFVVAGEEGVHELREIGVEQREGVLPRRFRARRVEVVPKQRVGVVGRDFGLSRRRV